MSVFHERLRTLRDKRGNTQAKIAEGIGITPQALSYYFNNREPNFDTLCRIARYFNVSTDYLLGLSECEKAENDDICKKTGLEETTIDHLIRCHENAQNDVFFSVPAGEVYTREELGITKAFTPSDFINELVRFNSQNPHSLFVITATISKLLYSTHENFSYSDKVDVEGGRLFACQQAFLGLIEQIRESYSGGDAP